MPKGQLSKTLWENPTYRKHMQDIHRGQHSSPATEFKKGNIPWLKGKSIKINDALEKWYRNGGIPWNKGKKGLMPIPWNKGKTKANDPRIPQHWLGKKRGNLHNEEYKKRMRERTGESCPAWKGGITPLLKLIRHCFKYRQWRSDIFQRDDYTCQICNQRGGELNADHHPKMFSEIFAENKIKTLGEALVCEEFWNLNNGRTLCKPCHQKYGKKK